MFQYWPLVSTTTPRGSSELQLWLRMIEIWHACREINVMATGIAPSPLGGPRWPKHSRVWDRGVITGIAEASGKHLVSTANDDGTPNEWCDDTYDNPWSCIPELHNPEGPPSWKLVIEDCDPRAIIIVDIESWTEDTLQVPDLTHFVVERVIADLESLIGKSYFIIRGDYGIWWSQRIPAWPNSRVYFKGSDENGTPNSFSATSTMLTDNGKKKIGRNWISSWTANQWNDYDLIFKDAGGVMHRATISANTANTLTFADVGAIPSNTYPYYIIEKDGLYQWDRVPANPFAWYTGLTEDFWSLAPNDVLFTTPKPKLQITHGTGPFCIDQTYDIFDVDHWTDDGAACNDDKAWNPWVTQSLRWIQKFIEDICPYFILAGNYHGVAPLVSKR